MRRTTTLVSVAVALAAAACSGASPATPSPTQLQSEFARIAMSADYVFHYAEGDTVNVERQQAFHAWATERLQLTAPVRIDYYKYRDREQFARMTGGTGTGWADPPEYAVHSIWPWDGHEAVHVLTAQLGHPPEFLNEGIAMALSADPANGRYDPLWNNASVHDWCAYSLKAGSLRPLREIAESNDFRARPADMTYRVSGSFVRYLLDTHGIDAFKRLLHGDWVGAPLKTIDERMLAAYGRSLDTAESEWRAWLLAR